jgi:outer membrane protein TolC
MSDRQSSRARFALRSLAVAAGLAAAALARAQVAPAEPQTLTLRRAAELALERAPQLAATRAARDEGGASARIAADALHPSVWLSTTPGYSTGLPVVVAGSVPAYGALEVRQTIYDPWKKNDALQAEARAADLEGALESGCAETVRAAVTAYARCWTDERRAEAATKGLSATEAALQRTIALFDEGRKTEIDVDRARLQAARARQKVLNAESDRDLDGLDLKRLIGWPASAPLRLSSDTESALAAVSDADNLAVARASDPQLKSLGRQVELLGQSARLSSKRWPIIEASAQYQRLPSYYSKYYNSFNENDFSFGISFVIPVWAGGRIDDTEAKAKASVLRAEAERSARESDLEASVRRAEAAVARADAEHGLSRRAQGIAEQDLASAELLAREGRGEAAAVEERRILAADADEDATKTALTVLEDRVHLLALRGELARTVLGSEPPCALSAPR